MHFFSIDNIGQEFKNLQIILREIHELEHGKFIYENGEKYIRLVPANRRRK